MCVIVFDVGFYNCMMLLFELIVMSECVVVASFSVNVRYFVGSLTSYVECKLFVF